MGPLIELSATLDTHVPNAEALFRIGSSGSKAAFVENGNKILYYIIMPYAYSCETARSNNKCIDIYAGVTT